MYNEILGLCRDRLSKTPGFEVSDPIDNCKFHVEVGDDSYTVMIDDFDSDEEDEEGFDFKKDRTYFRPNADHDYDHSDILNVCLDALAKSDLIITGFTTDGDHKDCEAIFTIDDNEYVLKIR